jgi:hypothetical protein
VQSIKIVDGRVVSSDNWERKLLDQHAPRH